MLAAVYRQTGNLVEAGRWGFLTDDVRPEEIAAYHKANSDPWQRLRLLHFAGDPAVLPDAAEERLAGLAQEAQASGPPTQWSGGYRPPSQSHSATLPCLFTVIVLSAVIVLAGIGALKILDWLAH